MALHIPLRSSGRSPQARPPHSPHFWRSHLEFASLWPKHRQRLLSRARRAVHHEKSEQLPLNLVSRPSNARRPPPKRYQALRPDSPLELSSPPPRQSSQEYPRKQEKRRLSPFSFPAV